MKKSAALVTLVVAVVAFSAQTARKPKPTGTSGSSADASALVALENAWPDAMAKKDVSFIETNYSDDATDVAPDGMLSTKQQDIDDLKSGNFALEGGTTADLQPRVYGDFAVVTGTNHLRGKYKGQDITGRYRFTDTFIKRNGQWKLLATQATKIMSENEEKK
ncbi:MAG: nuclear transport factor 2 family protein [Bacteroidales bacterium]